MNEQVIKTILKERFESHIQRHSSIRWEDIENLLTPELLEAVSYMEETKGDPMLLCWRASFVFVTFQRKVRKEEVYVMTKKLD